MKRSSQILLSFFFLAGVVAAQADLSAPIPTDPSVKIGKLPNGLTYYIKKNAKPENKVELRLAVNAGSLLERDDQRGVVNFLEHMAFNGMNGYKRNELISYLQSIGVEFGADLNAYTTFDETVYILPIPTEKPENLDRGLQILRGWASDLTLDPEEIDRERGVVLEELRLGQGAAQRMLDKYLPKVFGGSRYAERLPIGKKEILERFNRQAILDFYEDWYRPDLMAVVAVGNLDVGEIETKIRAKFSDMKAKRAAKPRPEFDVPDHAETLTALATDKEAMMASATLLYKKPAATLRTRKDYKRQLLMAFYAGMLNKRLEEIRQSPNSPFMSGMAGFGQLTRNKGSYFMQGITDPKNISMTISALLAENRRVREFGFLPGELTREKQEYLSQLENSYKERVNTESAAFANSFVASFLQKTAVPSMDFTYEFSNTVVPSISLEEVNALAKETVTDGNRVIVITGIEKSDASYPTESEIASLLRTSESAKLTAYVDNVSAEPLIEGLETTAKVIDEKFDPKFGIHYWTLSNGVKVALKPTDFRADEVSMEGFSPGGLSLVNDDKRLAGRLAASISKASGVKSMSSVQLDKALAGKNAGATVFLTDLYEYVSGSSTTKDLETMLQLAYLRLTSVNFEKAVFDSIVSKEKKLYVDALSDPQTFFSEEVNRIMTQNHPRADRIPTAEQLDAVSLDDVKAIYRDRFGDASDFTFVFVGSFEKDRIKPLILKYLGNLCGTNRSEKWKDPGIRPPPGYIDKVVRKGIEKKSFVQLKFSEETRYDIGDDRLLSVLGDLLTNKLIEILREEKSGVYGVSASGGLSKTPYEQFNFTVGFACGPENVKALTDAALAELAKIQSGQIDEKDLNKVKASRLVKARENVKQNWYWLDEILSHLQHGEQPRSLDDIEKYINAITRDDLQRVAKKYIHLSRKKQFVLMPEGETGAKEANLVNQLNIANILLDFDHLVRQPSSF